jgi:hypothetical protein
MNATPPRLVVPQTTAREALIAAVAGLLALAFLMYGIVHFARLSHRAKANTLTGIVIDRQFTPTPPEQQITIGRGGLQAKQHDGEYLLRVRVDSESGRIFEVPVEKSVYDAKKVGDPLTFLRPPSERQ